jgi:hypothetical protein
MKKIVLSLAVLSAILLPALCAAPARAFSTWVSRFGDDTNVCTPVAPCKTIAHALIQAGTGGEVICLDAGGFGTGFTITKSVTIDCSKVMETSTFLDGSISCTDAITINAPGSVVTLRGLKLDGRFFFCAGNGIVIQAASSVSIEDCVIERFPQKGIVDLRTTGLTWLTIKNTIVRYQETAGIVVAAAPRNAVVLENVHSIGNTYGLAVATGNNVVIANSVMSQNTIAGIEADPGAQVFVDTTRISHNANYGIYAVGSVTLANSDIAFNNSSISGATMSYGNNRIYGNGPGDAPTPIGQQ